MIEMRLKRPACASFLVVLLLAMASPARAESERKLMLGAGIGLGELIHGELGVFLTPRLLLEARAGWVIFSPVVGSGISYSFGERRGAGPPRHGWLVRAELMANPTLGELRLEEQGETIGAYAAAYGGYAFTSDGGFYFRALAGALFGKEKSRPAGAMGPNFTFTFGLAL